MKALIGLFTIAVMCLLGGIYYETHQVKRVLEEKDRLIDSLQSEVFAAEIMVNRYEITLEHMETTNPKAALEFVNYMNHETE